MTLLAPWQLPRATTSYTMVAIKLWRRMVGRGVSQKGMRSGGDRKCDLNNVQVWPREANPRELISLWSGVKLAQRPRGERKSQTTILVDARVGHQRPPPPLELAEDKKRHRVSGARIPVIRGSPRLKAESEIISEQAAEMEMELCMGQSQPCTRRPNSGQGCRDQRRATASR